MICINAILEMALYLLELVCLIVSLMLTQLVYLRIDWIFFWGIKHDIMIIKPTLPVLGFEVSCNYTKFFMFL